MDTRTPFDGAANPLIGTDAFIGSRFTNGALDGCSIVAYCKSSSRPQPAIEEREVMGAVFQGFANSCLKVIPLMDVIRAVVTNVLYRFGCAGV